MPRGGIAQCSFFVATKPKLLIFELWGVGDLVLATTLIDQARVDHEVHVLAKPFARELLGPTYPDVIFHALVAPWTAHYGKYRLWRWNWLDLARVLVDLAKEKFAAAVSVRPDPRDHFLMWLIGARRRVGVPIKGSGVLLNELMREPEEKWHRVETYREAGRRLHVAKIDNSIPRLDGGNYRTDRVRKILSGASKPIVCAHLGAGQPVRRWPEKYWQEILFGLRAKFDFHLILVPDEDGFGSPLQSLADGMISNLDITELVDLMAQSKLLLCHDSGPMHVAVACNVPTISWFGPGDPRWFRPWGDIHKMIIRDICPYRPCFDFCRFPENYCLTKLIPAEVWPEIEQSFGAAINLAPARLGTSTIPTSASSP